MDEALPSIVKRPIHRPFFLLHTPDKIGNYLQKDMLRIVMAKREKISAFLAPATLAEAGTDARGKPVQEVAYDLSACQEDLSPMEYLPPAVVTAIEQAAKEFCASGARITDYELKLRQGFRLPDPDIDPQAYMVFGPPENRQLVILWGTEAKQDSSLPLIPIQGYQGPTIVDKLRSRIMGAAAMRQEALKLLDRSNHPLAHYIATEVRGGDGKVHELLNLGKRIPINQVKKMRHLPKTEIEAFAAAARQYYEEAYPDAVGISAYEKELRAALRLPSLQACPKSFYKHGKKLLILCSPSDDLEKCLCLTNDSVLGLPAPKTDEQGRQIAEPTITEQLEARATPVKLYAIIAAASIVIVGGLAALGVALLDTDPPAIVQNGREDAIITTKSLGEGQHIDTPQNLHILWTDEIDASSLKLAAGDASAGTFTITDDDGRAIAVSAIHLSEDKKVTDLDLATPMQDGKNYKLEVRKVADTSMRHNAIDTITKSFTYRDTVAPTVKTTSAEGTDSRKLVVTFDEPLNVESTKNRYNFKIDGFNVVADPVYVPETNSVIITFEKQNATGLDKGFVNKGVYTLTIDRGIRDASTSGNSHKEPYDVKVIYEDTVPPIISKASYTSQTEITLVFGEPVKQESVLADTFKIQSAPKNDAAADDAEVETLEVERADLSPDKYTVHLVTGPMRRIKYKISATGVEDLQGNKIPTDKPATVTFFYDGKEDKEPPVISSSKSIDDSRIFELTFSKPVKAGTILKEAFEVRSDMRNEIVEVSDAQVSGVNPAKVIITLGVNSIPGERIYVIARNIEDRIGNKAKQVKSGFFQIRKNPMPYSYLNALNCRLLSKDTLELTFKQEIDTENAKELRHYYFSGNAMVDKVTVDPAKADTVILHLSAPEAQIGQIVIASALILKGDTNPETPVSFTIKP